VQWLCADRRFHGRVVLCQCRGATAIATMAKRSATQNRFSASTPMLAAISTKRLAYFDEGLGEVLM
jgi:hypothetical protein